MTQEIQTPRRSSSRRLIAGFMVILFMVVVGVGVSLYALARGVAADITLPLADSLKQIVEQVSQGNRNSATQFDPKVLDTLKHELAPKVKEPSSEVSSGASEPTGIVKYVDRDGRTHYVDSIEKVPEQYRGKAVNADNLPRINRLDISVGSKGSNEPSIPAMVSRAISLPNKSSKKVELFVTSWCSFCQQMESFLRKEGVPFTKYDIEKSSTGAALHAKLGGGGVPVTRVGTQVIRGYAPDEVMSALGKFKS